ncbi:helix-turn-helix domain-containing protein [Ohtaekwangia kribbensis]|uniref:Helix-turn-helix domain-containing protein n=1 Tax=Ohtaekwangia kribbensis TaxID=688913 RepID=A0ABW3K2P7_9BACT
MKEDEILKSLQERIGQKITELRKQKGYTSHEDFAHEFEIPRMQYWRIEKGRTNLTLRTLVKLLSIHKMTAEEFFSSLQKKEVKNRK